MDKAKELGFALGKIDYYYINVEGERRKNAGEFARDTIHSVNPHAWDVHAEVWEALTKTWMVLIKARQEKAAAERAELIDQVNEMTDEEIADLILSRVKPPAI